MMKRVSLMLYLTFVLFAFGAASDGFAQTRKAVGAAEVNGTFRDYFEGKFKGNFNEIKILALGKGKLRVSFGLTYPFIDGTGAMSANVGEARGTAEIVGDTATFTDAENGECKITIKFVKPGTIKVTQNGDSSGCGFGFNVSADGTYKKTSAAKPTFE